MTVVLRLAILVAGVVLVVPTADAQLRYQDRLAATGLSHVYGGSTGLRRRRRRSGAGLQ